MKKLFTLLIVVHFSIKVLAQTGINAYANVTAISGTSISVNNVSETNHTFEDGDYIIIMQMQDNVIGTNTTNAATFGNLGSIQSAGLYEVARISSHTESGSLPTSITVTTALVNTYNLNANASVQIISFRFLGANFTTTANIGTTAWNGTIGGVTAMSVSSTFSLNHNITANQAGFQGGLRNTPNGFSACRSGTYTTARGTFYAEKGQGIYKRTNVNFGGARGKILNGGGGGVDVNSGGGGGGNYTAGGDGGAGWVPAGTGCSPVAGGLGGLSLVSQISASRIFMGGGGGGGHENDGNGQPGGIGGGIILIKTSTLVTNSCAGVVISANGGTVVNATNDGAGGGGAGGTILFQVNTFSISGGCPLTISSNGGGGGSSNTSGVHGGGGGGGQGAVIYSTAQPTTNMTTNTIPGAGGTSCGGCTGATNGSVGGGVSNSGIIPNTSGPLPVELLWFKASYEDDNIVKLTWATAIEKSSDKFIIQRMLRDDSVQNIGELKSKGNYSSYTFHDYEPKHGLNYYRLKQIDKDGKVNLKPWHEIYVEKKFTNLDVVISPNPNSGELLEIECIGSMQSEINVVMMDALGNTILNKALFSSEKTNKFQLPHSTLKNGIYFLKIELNKIVVMKKLIISN